MFDVKEYTSEFQTTIDHFKQELSGLRTGRAQSALVEHLMVDAYGVPTPLKHCASISIPDAKTISLAPWDKSLLKEIEKTVSLANMGINPLNDGTTIRLIIPAMTEETRKQLLKILGQKLETTRISLRGIRDSMREEVTRQERSKEITEDDRYQLFKEIDEVTKQMVTRVDEMGKAKEQEIMTI